MRGTLPTKGLRLVALLLAAASPGIYLACSASAGETGFPLDDAWIHQTYARNLAQSGSLAFVPGQPSAGSTSPLWSAALAIGYLLGIDPRIWAYAIGGGWLVLTAGLAFRLLRRLFPAQRYAPALAALFCALEWHLVWAAVSGMETLLFTGLTLAAVDLAFTERERPTLRHAAWLGVAGGLLPLARPEGVLLTVLLVLVLPITLPPPSRKGLGHAAAVGAIAALVMAPFLAFTLQTSGSLFPNTFYAKQAEYQLALSLPARLLRVFWAPWVGPQVLLLPGLLAAAVRFVRARRWLALLPLAWWACLVGIYALRLPVTYQHGRYLMPAIPWLAVYGIGGSGLLLRPESRRAPIRLASRAVPAATAVLLLLFVGLGARAYRDDVGFIQGEMVQTARWLAAHTAPSSLIAAHDVGAIGYFADRPILDLAGLVTPEVIPFISDADRLVGFMQAEGSQYAAFFPDFSPTYRQIAADARLQVIYRTDYGWTRTQGLANMAVYRVRSQEGGE